MAGWSILDYALNFAPEGDAEKYARLGYASILSSWALINSGTAASNYGYWFPGLANDGATGWAFEPTKYGPTWGVGDVPRGIWHYDGEINHGLTGGVNAACTVVCNDPIFGLIAYGGSLNQQDGKISVVPADGLRQKFYIKIGDCRVHIEFERDGFAQNTPVIFNNPVRFLHFTLENRTADTHITKLSLSGLERGCYRLMINNVTQYSFRVEDLSQFVLDVTVGSSLTYDITVSLAADIDEDSDVDFKDFALFALQWQEDNSNPCFGADLTGDGIVNEEDLEKILNCWLM